MGLDMYAGKIRRRDGASLPFTGPDELRGLVWTESGKARPEFEVGELAYWRKHHDLHGLMERLYNERGGNASFNCVPIILSLEDLERIEEATKTGTLPATSGFFFGSDNTDYYAKETLEFVEKARQAISEGWVVYYDSWW